jgi:hypothetical protein
MFLSSTTGSAFFARLGAFATAGAHTITPGSSVVSDGTLLRIVTKEFAGTMFVVGGVLLWIVLISSAIRLEENLSENFIRNVIRRIEVFDAIHIGKRC